MAEGKASWVKHAVPAKREVLHGVLRQQNRTDENGKGELKKVIEGSRACRLPLLLSTGLEISDGDLGL